MPTDDYKKLGYRWKDFERDLQNTKTAPRIEYDPFIEDDTSLDYRLIWRPTAFVTDLFVLPTSFSLLPLSEVLEPRAIPEFPHRPEPPSIELEDKAYPDWYNREWRDRDRETRKKLIERLNATRAEDEHIRAQFTAQRNAALRDSANLLQLVDSGDFNAIARVIQIAYLRHRLPKTLRKPCLVRVDQERKIAGVQIEFPDFKNIPFLLTYSGKYHDKPKYATAGQHRNLVKCCLYSLIVRAAYICAAYLPTNEIPSVVVNVRQTWFDAATGQPREGIIASLQAATDYLTTLDLSKLEPEACFRNLKGLVTPSLENASPIRPILVLDKSDERFVESRAVTSGVDSEANLAAIPWDDFEHLVAQLFEWEFARNGIEVRVTRASRDRGVDAILFDPDPLRGGKYVLQAKRYTRTVDVSAVRDLYGTVMNEGANRGILITTSGYGPDSYEFAKDKPLSLVDGPNLLAMLQKHGRKFRIDLDEARSLSVTDQI